MKLGVSPGAVLATEAAVLIINGMSIETRGIAVSARANHISHNACEGQSSCKSTTGCKGKGKFSA